MGSVKISKKKITIAGFALLVFLLVASPYINYGYLWCYKKVIDALYVTDPENPEFKVDEFRFWKYALIDYNDQTKLMNTLNYMLPKGTDRARVDQVLVDIGGAKITFGSDKIIRYYYPAPSILPSMLDTIFGCSTKWTVIVTFEQKNGEFFLVEQVIPLLC